MSKVFNLPINWFGRDGRSYKVNWTENGNMSGWETNSIEIDSRDIIYGVPALDPGKACPEAVWNEDRDGLWYATLKVGA